MQHSFDVELAKELLDGSTVNVGTVIGFPLGQNTKEIKILETIDAIKNGWKVSWTCSISCS